MKEGHRRRGSSQEEDDRGELLPKGRSLEFAFHPVGGKVLAPRQGGNESCGMPASIVSTGPSAYTSEQERRQHCMRHPQCWPLTLPSPLLGCYARLPNLFMFLNTSLNCSFGLMVVETSLSSTKHPLLAHHHQPISLRLTTAMIATAGF